MVRGVLPRFALFLAATSLAIWSAPGRGGYRADPAVLQHFGSEMVWLGSPGILLGELTRMLPIGEAVLRAGLVSALCHGLLAVLIWGEAERWLRDRGETSSLDPWFALGATLGFVGCLPALTEASVLAGGTLGALLGFLLLVLPEPDRQGPASRSAWAAIRGACTALALLESPAVGGICIVVLALGKISWGRRWESRRGPAPTGRLVQPLVLGGLAAVVLVALGQADRWRGAWPTRTHSLISSLPAEVQWAQPGDWIHHLGFFWLSAGLAGFVLTCFRDGGRSLRWLPLWALDLLLPRVAGATSVTPDLIGPREALHLVGLALFVIYGALGLRALATLAQGLELAFARAAGALLAALGIAAALAGAEDSASLLAQTPVVLHDEVVQEGLGRLPPRALVLSSSRDLALLLGGELALGSRPDVLHLSPEDLLNARRLGRARAVEPRLRQLAVDFHLAGEPSELGLHLIGQTRPVFVEPDPSWDERILAHMEPRLLLPRYSPHALGSSERQLRIRAEMEMLARWERLARAGIAHDLTTASLLADRRLRLGQLVRRVGDQGSIDLIAKMDDPVHPARK